MFFRSFILSLSFVTFLVCGCSDKKDLLPCSPNGLGAEEYNGVTPEDQVLNYKDYDCSQAQICPDQGNAYVPYYVVDETAAAAPVNLGITNCSTGNEKLLIEKVVIYGDSRCSFSEATIEKATVDPGETVIIKTDYKPTSAGEDHAQFRIFSNAQNFATLIVPFCSAAGDLPPDAGTEDGGTIGSKPSTCQEVNTINTTCHQE